MRVTCAIQETIHPSADKAIQVDEMLLRIQDVQAEFGDRSHTSVYTRIKDGLFTQPVKTGARCSAWPKHEIEVIKAARVAGKTDDEIRSLVNTLHEQRATRFAELAARLTEPALQ